MSKKILALMMGLAMVIALSACTGDSGNQNSGDNALSASQNGQAQTEDVFAKFENGLSDLGLTYSAKTETVADMIGGIKGQKYTMDGYTIELYQFEPSSDAYKSAEEKQAVTMEGFGDFSVYVHNGMVMMKDGVPQNVVDLFNTL